MSTEVEATVKGPGGARHAARAFAAVILIVGAWAVLRPEGVPLHDDPAFAHLAERHNSLERAAGFDTGLRPEPREGIEEGTTALEFQRRFDREATDLETLQHAEDLLAAGVLDGPAVDAFLEQRDFAVRQMRRAAGALARGSLQSDLDDDSTGGPDRSTVRTVTIAAVLEARRDTAAGRTRSAAERLVDLFQYGADLVAGRSLATVAAGLDVMRGALDELETALAAAPLRSTGRAAVHARLHAAAATIPLDGRVLLGEWVTTGRMFARAAAGTASDAGRPDEAFLRGAAESWDAWDDWRERARTALATPPGAGRLAAVAAVDDAPCPAGMTGLEVRPPRLQAVAARLARLRARAAGLLALLAPDAAAGTPPVPADLHPAAVERRPDGSIVVHAFTPDAQPWSAVLPPLADAAD